MYDSRKGENCIVAFITSAQRQKLYPFDVPLLASKQNGLLLDSIITLDHLATLQKNIVLGELGVVESPVMSAVEKKLKMLFGL